MAAAGAGAWHPYLVDIVQRAAPSAPRFRCSGACIAFLRVADNCSTPGCTCRSSTAQSPLFLPSRRRTAPGNPPPRRTQCSRAPQLQLLLRHHSLGLCGQTRGRLRTRLCSCCWEMTGTAFLFAQAACGDSARSQCKAERATCVHRIASCRLRAAPTLSCNDMDQHNRPD